MCSAPLNKVILCLGSNTEAEDNIRFAAGALREYFLSINFSEAVYTEPIDCDSAALFMNQIAIAYTNIGLDEVRNELKRIEKNLGRIPEHKFNGQVLIDIDLILWNDIILKPKDWERDYVQEGLRFLFLAGENDEWG